MTTSSRPPSRAPGPGSRPTSGQKLLLVGFGLGLLLLTEALLRLAGLGGAPPLLLPLTEPGAGDAAVYEINPRVAAPFFARSAPDGSEAVGAHRRELVTLPKPVGTVRVLFLGASSVEGFPLPRNLTSSAFLEAGLARALPERDVEVLNLGITAVASYPVRVVGTAAIRELDPDLVLVYSGHNELFGASGVASHQYLGSGVATMRLLTGLRATGWGQLLQRSLRRPPPTREGQRTNLIEIMAAVPEIEPGGPLHAAARRNLAANLGALVDAAEQAGVPIVLATLASLERGLVPIRSFDPRPPEARRELEQRLVAASEGLREDPASALARLEPLAAATPGHAEAVYRHALTLYWMQRLDASAAGFRRARDLDAMPWRAPSDRNELIRDLAARRGVPLADVAAAFAEAAGGATDWSLFSDHVHPSLRGQALMAETLLATLAREGLLELESRRLPEALPWQEEAQRLGVHPLEHYLVLHKMKTLFGTPPLSTRNGHLAGMFERRLHNLRAGLDPIDQAGVETWEQMSEEAGLALPISYPAALAALARGDTARAHTYLNGAILNAYELSAERCLAREAKLEAYLLEGAEPWAAELETAQHEVEILLALPGHPTPLLAACRARLLTLAGDPQADPAWSQAEELRPAAPRWAQPYLQRLPTRAVLERLRDREAAAPPGAEQSSPVDRPASDPGS